MKGSSCIVYLMVFIYLIPVPGSAIAQGNAADSNFYASALDATLRTVYQQAADQSGLYNGPLYPGYPFSFKKGSPYFEPAQFSPGDIDYDHLRYQNIPLLYDELRDLLIIQDNQFPLQLVNSFLSGFTLHGHQFVKWEGAGPKEFNGREVFFELLVQGPIQVLKKESKKLSEEVSVDLGIERSVLQEERYFIGREGSLSEIRKERDLLGLLKDRQKEIRQYLKDHQLKFRDDPEKLLIQVAGYYEKISR
jgi:hypothetical protein